MRRYITCVSDSEKNAISWGKNQLKLLKENPFKLAVLLTDTGSTKKSLRQNLNLLVLKPKLKKKKKKKKGKKNVQLTKLQHYS
jgi:hypothetical protein